jgi:serine phosphatase RsbU (regulator of sigma subunit)
LRLHDKQRSIASALQAGLLAQALPQIPGVDIAVRYWAAGEGIEVGGDFYDAFQVSDGKWAVVVGDVCGTGPTAASVTGLARHTVASAAWHHDDPIEVLCHLNRTIRARGLDTFCTVAYATIEPSIEGVTANLACGGHPLPIIARADGTVGSWGRPGTLVGMFDDYTAASTTTTLATGDTLVFYTDGVTDVRPPHELTSDDFAALVGQAARLATSADDLANRLRTQLSALLPIESRTDDIALLILRGTEYPATAGAVELST